MVTMTKPATPRLVARLKEICREEGLQADMKAMVALIEMTDADIRSCLNTLQVRRQEPVVHTQGWRARKSGRRPN